MALIKTLERDIKKVLSEGHVLSHEVLGKFGANISVKLDRQLTRREPRQPNVIRASEIGMLDTCPRKFWYSFHAPEAAEKHSGETVMKFLYGDIIEETVVTLAKAAAHTVEHEQADVYFKIGHYEVKGHIDCIIDGVLVDVKSTTSFGMRDFEAGKGGDKFGYRAQLNVYSVGMGVKEKGWVCVDKQLGSIKYFPETKPYDIYKLFDKAQDVLGMPTPVGKLNRLRAVAEPNGNMALCTECRYCSYKKECWKDANGGVGVRTFKYSDGPKYLVHVASEPRVDEIK
jgi:hypothetical protein